MTLLVDTFWPEAEARLIAAGWTITSYSRYDPTSIAGLTPSGKSFTATMNGNAVSITVAGKTGSIVRSKSVWEPGDATVQAILDAWNQLPAAQQ